MERTGWYRLIVRIMETMLCSIIPSAICLFILTRVPSETLWIVLCVIAFLLCALANGFFWFWDNVSIGHNPKSYFVINTIAYAVFMVSSYLVFKFTSAVIYSAGFASLRAFEEIFKLRKIYSINISHAVLLCEMAAVYFLGHIYVINHSIPEVDIDAVLEEGNVFDDDEYDDDDYEYDDEYEDEDYEDDEYDDEEY